MPLLGNQLYAVQPRDPLTLAGVPVVLIVVAILAALIPARRAMRVDPVRRCATSRMTLAPLGACLLVGRTARLRSVQELGARPPRTRTSRGAPPRDTRFVSADSRLRRGRARPQAARSECLTRAHRTGRAAARRFYPPSPRRGEATVLHRAKRGVLQRARASCPQASSASSRVTRSSSCLTTARTVLGSLRSTPARASRFIG